MGITFSHRDLRNRSFYQQDLRNAVFEDCDLRGCDFRKAQLQGATFRRVRFGLSLSKLIGYGAIALGTAVLTFHAISHMLFGAIGTIPSNPTWGLIVTLYVFVAISGLGALPQLWLPKPLKKLAILPTLATGALLGFYYGGSAADQDPQVAMVAAILAGLLTTVIQLTRPQAGWLTGTIALAESVAAYGAAFVTVGLASAGLSTGHWLVGLGWVVLSLLYFGLTLAGLANGSKTLKQAASTQFQHTDLSQTQFDRA